MQSQCLTGPVWKISQAIAKITYDRLAALADAAHKVKYFMLELVDLPMLSFSSGWNDWT